MDAGTAVGPVREPGEARRLIADAPKSVIFFTVDKVSMRAIKMAWGLRRRGWLVVLIHLGRSFFDLTGSFDAVLSARDASAALTLAASLPAGLYHVFAQAMNQTILDVCRRKPGPIILDAYDLWTPSLMTAYPQFHAPTLEALALVDGFCARDRRYLAARKYDAPAATESAVIFSDYCWDNMPIGPPPPRRGEMHVVSIGSIGINHMVSEIIRRLIEAEIDFHVYPHWLFDESAGDWNFDVHFADYIPLARDTPFLHLYRPLPYDQLMTRIREHDFGLAIDGDPDFRFFDHEAVSSRECRDGAYAMRVADYMDAGLPVLINDELRFTAELLKSLGRRVNADVLLGSNPKESLAAIKERMSVPGEALKARREFSILNHIGELERFYLNVRQGAPRTKPSALPAERAPALIPATAASDGPADRFTLLVPARDRPAELSALLRFLEKQGAAFPILVLDSSRADNKRLNAKAIAASGANVRHLLYNELLPLFEKLRRGSAEARTPYCAQCPGGVLFFPRALGAITDFLDERADYAAADGYIAHASPLPGDAGKTEFLRIGNANPAPDDDDPLIRLFENFSRDDDKVCAVYRTAMYKQTLDSLRGLPNVRAEEIALAAMTLARGKSGRLPLLYACRRPLCRHGAGIEPPPNFVFMADSLAERFRSYSLVRGRLTEFLRLNYPGRYAGEHWEQFVDLIFANHFIDRHSKDSLRAAFENGIRTVNRPFPDEAPAANAEPALAKPTDRPARPKRLKAWLLKRPATAWPIVILRPGSRTLRHIVRGLRKHMAASVFPRRGVREKPPRPGTQAARSAASGPESRYVLSSRFLEDLAMLGLGGNDELGVFLTAYGDYEPPE